MKLEEKAIPPEGKNIVFVKGENGKFSPALKVLPNDTFQPCEKEM